MQMSLNRKKSSPGVREIQELEGVVGPQMTSPVIREVEVDDDGVRWEIKFLECQNGCWKVRWERVAAV